MLFSCTQDNQEAIEQDQNLMAPTESFSDIKTMRPIASNDLASEGMYIGVLVTNEIEHHGRLFINVGNDGTYRALVETTESELIKFTSPSASSLTNSRFVFIGDRGSFTLDVSDIEAPIISDVIIDNISGQAQVQKNTTTRGVAAVLGTFNRALTGANGWIGTWDLLINTTTGFISSVIVTTAAGVMSTDVAANFENGTGCYASNKPFFIRNDTNGQYEIMAIGQNWTLPNGLRIFYDFGFSRVLATNNAAPLTTGYFFPQAVNNFLYNPPLNPANGTCFSFNNTHGYYVVRNAANTAFRSAGVITFDFSGVPAAIQNADNYSINASQSLQGPRASLQLEN